MVCSTRSHPIIYHIDPIVDKYKVSGESAINPIRITAPPLHAFKMFCFIDALIEVFFHEIEMLRTTKSHALSKM
jgi:hypothetical protein